ncbi:beta-lactamase family protein [Hymenobacter sp. BT683]|uniref:Beta-lactamase family protein n=1 Tax=Hymenobacter jeongseonensis TaxID=2791027 RepID=A0ABS0II63_9BACT|nr:serine hydrolase domain-containing protein [Hymenobacter jeongseonensis]MBF9237867.1 beta-lactamase family protein [Hymenobacter jeongseonensis]
MRISFITAFLITSSTGLFLASPAVQAQVLVLAAADTAGLTAQLRQRWQASDFPGFAVAVVRPDGVVYEHGFGYANKALKTPYTPATVQGVGSVSKTLIGVALLQAAAAGQLRLDQPVNELLPFAVHHPYFPNQPITLRQLATMTAGLTENQRFYSKHAYTKGTASALSSEEYLRRTLSPTGQWFSRRRFRPYAPGSSYAYSNESAALAALAIEKATGQAFSEFTRRHILLPLGLTDSGWNYAEIAASQMATLYSAKGKIVPPYYTITYPDGGLLTSVHSLGRYLHSIINPAVRGAPLPPAAVDSLLKPQFAAGRMPRHLDAAEPNQGLLWAHRRNGTVGHTGGDAGLTSFLFFDPVTRVGKILVTNTEVQPGPRSLKQFKAIWKLLDQVH